LDKLQVEEEPPLILGELFVRHVNNGLHLDERSRAYALPRNGADAF
jgi:hypothetical protein